MSDHPVYFIHYHKKTGWSWCLNSYCKTLHHSKFFKTKKGCTDNMLAFKNFAAAALFQYSKPAIAEITRRNGVK